MDKILTVDDVAAILQVQPITVREMFREKRLRAFKIGKAWRTTPEMLQEDIQTLARGERPPALVQPAKPVEETPPAEPAAMDPRGVSKKRRPAQAPAPADAAPSVSEGDAPSNPQDFLF